MSHLFMVGHMYAVMVRLVGEVKLVSLGECRPRLLFTPAMC